MKSIVILSALFLMLQNCQQAQEQPFLGAAYPCFFTKNKPRMDGHLEPVWDQATWSTDFVDIRGEVFPKPHFQTRFKMLWSKTHLYIAAEIEDEDLWTTMTDDESPLYQQDVFEVFIDPESDGLQYYELEVNAHGTKWDLMLDRPYNEGGKANSQWDIEGLQIGKQLKGTLNDPQDKDQSWTLELAIPIANLFQGQKPSFSTLKNTEWAINFLRVDWDLSSEDGLYQKAINPKTKQVQQEHFWVWKPHGKINMHLPHKWGKVKLLN